MLNSPKSMREDDISSTDYVNTVPFLCPNLEELYLGYKQVFINNGTMSGM